MTGLPAASFTRIAPPTGIASTLASAATPAPPSTVRRDRLAAPIAPPRPREASARSVSSILLLSRFASRIVALQLSGAEALADHCSTLPTTGHPESRPASRRALGAGRLAPNG